MMFTAPISSASRTTTLPSLGLRVPCATQFLELKCDYERRETNIALFECVETTTTEARVGKSPNYAGGFRLYVTKVTVEDPPLTKQRTLISAVPATTTTF